MKKVRKNIMIRPGVVILAEKLQKKNPKRFRSLSGVIDEAIKDTASNEGVE